MRPFQLAIKLIFLLIALVSCEQKRKYWIYFNNVENSSLVKNELLSYTENSKSIFIPKDSLNITVDFYSKWLHAGTAWLSKSEHVTLSQFDDVKEISPISKAKLIPNTLNYIDIQFSFAMEQIWAEYFIEKGLTGKGVKIGIIDGGFLDANNKISLSHIFKNQAVKPYKDYLTPTLRQYGGSKGADDGHGTQVWTQIAGINPNRKVQFGLETAAEFYLARTDDGRKENRTEEEYLIQALEWMHSQGVKLVNISLGYSTGFDNPEENYLPKHVDGKFTAVTRAVNIASEQKGMLIIVSAGNDGQNDFKVLSVPADAKGVLTVGATNYKTWDKASYSSIGPDKFDFLKPNVACFAFNGPSFSAPVITGLAACISS